MRPGQPADPDLHAKLRQRLQIREAELLAVIGRDTRELATPAGDRGEDTTPSFSDLGEDVAHREEMLVARWGNAEALERVRAALARIAIGTFGLCVDCGMPIPRARLIARADAERDIACQRRVDQQSG